MTCNAVDTTFYVCNQVMFGTHVENIVQRVKSHTIRIFEINNNRWNLSDPRGWNEHTEYYWYDVVWWHENNLQRLFEAVRANHSIRILNFMGPFDKYDVCRQGIACMSHRPTFCTIMCLALDDNWININTNEERTFLALNGDFNLQSLDAVLNYWENTSSMRVLLLQNIVLHGPLAQRVAQAYRNKSNMTRLRITLSDVDEKGFQAIQQALLANALLPQASLISFNCHRTKNASLKEVQPQLFRVHKGNRALACMMGLHHRLELNDDIMAMVTKLISSVQDNAESDSDSEDEADTLRYSDLLSEEADTLRYSALTSSDADDSSDISESESDSESYSESDADDSDYAYTD